MRRQLVGELRRVTLKEISRDMRREVTQQQHVGMIERFGQEFDDQLREFMLHLEADADIQYHSHLANLRTRLDYNGFLTVQLQQQRQ